MKLPIHVFAAVFLCGAHLTQGSASSPSVSETSFPKYVFFFLGDGMSSAQVAAAEAFKAGNEDSAATMRADDNRLHMTRMPAAGLCTTYSDTQFVTDSAAAATAFCCGIKTRPGAIGRNTKLDTSYKSIAELAQEKGRAIGIVSSVPLSHATPAGYYANVNNRHSYCEIGYQASQSGFDFFGGGLFPEMKSSKNKGKTPLRQAFAESGYTINTNKADILQLRNQSAGKVICSATTPREDNSMAYTIDQPEDYFTLAQMTQVGIRYLQADPEGFFILVEGGKIDWACHANDIATVLHEVIAFDNAIGVALNFMKQYPGDTLIVVTGDHETGGLALGYRGNGYQTDLARLRGQTKSGNRFIGEDLAQYKKMHPWKSIAESNIDNAMKDLIRNCFGLEWTSLSEYQRELLEKAYDASLGGVRHDKRPSGYDLSGSKNVDYLSYGGTDPLTVTITHILANEAGLEWSTSGHTGIPVPVFAAGTGSECFNGCYDNTDIAKKLGQLMKLPMLPVVDSTASDK